MLLRLSHYWRMCLSVFHNSVIWLLWAQTTVPTFCYSNTQMKNSAGGKKSMFHWLFTNVVLNIVSIFIRAKEVPTTLHCLHCSDLLLFSKPSFFSGYLVLALLQFWSLCLCFLSLLTLLQSLFPVSFPKSPAFFFIMTVVLLLSD